MLPQSFFVIIYRGINAPGHKRELLDGLNFVKKNLFQLISTVKLLGAKFYETHMVMHTGTHTSDASLARNFQKHLSNAGQKTWSD